MAIDYGALLYGPTYGVLGVPAQLTVSETAGPVEIIVIDKTTGLEVADGNNPEATRILPAACIQMAELAAKAVTRSQLDGSEITFNGRTWTIKFNGLRPAPTGEDTGEVLVYLEAA